MFPSTPESKLRKNLQEVDNEICKITNSPGVRFLERGGPTVMDTVGRTNPGGRDWFCDRKDCVSCLSRRILAADEAEDIIRMREGQEVKRNKPEDRVALPSALLKASTMWWSV